jgi:hypothetical protein
MVLLVKKRMRNGKRRWQKKRNDDYWRKEKL